jgi:hypothetical protein
MIVLGIDPGPVQSALVLFHSVDGADDPVTSGRVLRAGKEDNDIVRTLVGSIPDTDHFAIEMIASYGMPVGESVFRTCYWAGRFVQAYRAPDEVVELKRSEIKMHLCGSNRAKDANVRQALIDRFGGVEGKSRAIGLKKTPGPLYGFSKDMWAALGVVVTYIDGLGTPSDDGEE